MKDKILIKLINWLFQFVSPSYTKTLEALIREGMIAVNEEAYRKGSY